MLFDLHISNGVWKRNLATMLRKTSFLAQLAQIAN
jgi:hypothetical protein